MAETLVHSIINFCKRSCDQIVIAVVTNVSDIVTAQSPGMKRLTTSSLRVHSAEVRVGDRLTVGHGGISSAVILDDNWEFAFFCGIGTRV